MLLETVGDMRLLSAVQSIARSLAIIAGKIEREEKKERENEREKESAEQK